MSRGNVRIPQQGGADFLCCPQAQNTPARPLGRIGYRWKELRIEDLQTEIREVCMQKGEQEYVEERMEVGGERRI